MEEYRLVTDISSSVSYSENRHKNVKKSTYLNLIIGCTLSVVLCIVLLIVSILNVMWIHMNDSEQSIKTDSIKDLNGNYYIMLPVHANNGTVVTKTSVLYNKVPTAESTVFLLKLVGILAICSTKSLRVDDLIIRVVVGFLFFLDPICMSFKQAFALMFRHVLYIVYPRKIR